MAYNPVSLTGTSKTRFCRWWLWVVFTEAFIYGGVFDVHTSHDSLFDSFFTCHGTLKRKNSKMLVESDCSSRKWEINCYVMRAGNWIYAVEVVTETGHSQLLMAALNRVFDRTTPKSFLSKC